MDLQKVRDLRTRLAPVKRFLDDFGAAIDEAIPLQQRTQELNMTIGVLVAERDQLQTDCEALKGQLKALQGAIQAETKALQVMATEAAQERQKAIAGAAAEKARLQAEAEEHARQVKAQAALEIARLQEQSNHLQAEVSALTAARDQLRAALQSINV